MSKGQPRQFYESISQLMAVVAALGFAMALVVDPILDFLFARFSLIVFLPMIFARLIIDVVPTTRCPCCGDWTLKRVKVKSFGPRFFRCAECGAKRKRLWVGLMLDASGPKDARFYDHGRDPDPWKSEPILGTNDADFSGTQGALLRSKRRRDAHGTSFSVRSNAECSVHA
jgi:hypothetical protein